MWRCGSVSARARFLLWSPFGCGVPSAVVEVSLSGGCFLRGGKFGGVWPSGLEERVRCFLVSVVEERVLVNIASGVW